MENHILKLLSHQDNEGYRYLYKYYYVSLKSVANYYTKDDQAAEDLVQDVFISMLDHTYAFQDLKEVKYYLYASLKNRCLNHLRDLKTHDKYYRETLHCSRETGHYWDQVLKEDVYSTLFAAIQTLPPQCRQVMMLSLEGLKLGEIAERLQLSLETVKDHRKNGKKKLYDLLKQQGLGLLIWFWL